MTIQQLEYTVALDKHKNFVKAAESCFVTQPTLTMQIAKLEQQCDTKLFDRSKKPIETTAIGKQFVTKAHEVLRTVDEMNALVSKEKDSLDGEFRLGIIPTLAPYILPLLLPSFAQAHPHTHLIIKELQSELIIEALKSNSLDLALIVTPLGEKQLREIPIFHEPFLAYLPKGHELCEFEKLPQNVLDTHQLLILSEGHCFRNQTLNICKQSSKHGLSTFNYQSGSIEALKNLVDHGMGYTLIPELSVTKDIENAPCIKRFVPPEPSREVSLVTYKSFVREKLIDTVIETIRQNLPKNIVQTKSHKRIKWRD